MKKDTFIFLAFLVLVVVWIFHIPYAITPDVVKAFFYAKPNRYYSIVASNIKVFANFMACLLIFLSKAYLDSKYQQYKAYRISATLLANIAFFYAWLLTFFTNMFFYCSYKTAAECISVPNAPPCDNFPIELDIAYLLCVLPMLFMLSLALHYAFHNKALSKKNCKALMFLLVIYLINILLCFANKGIRCYD